MNTEEYKKQLEVWEKERAKALKKTNKKNYKPRDY